MNPEFERCLRSQKIKVFYRGKTLAGKELKVADSDLEQAKTLRESADYYDQWSKIGVETILKVAEEFLDNSTQLIRGIKGDK